MPDKVEQQDDSLEVVQEAVAVAETETVAKQEEGETKEHYEDECSISPMPVVVVEDVTAPGPTTFAAWDAKTEATEKASDMQFLTHQFQVLVNNVMQSPEIEDKGAAVEVLSGELSQRLNSVKERKSKWQPLTDKAVNFVADHIKAEMKTEGGIKFPASDFAFVPDVDKPSTWKLRMSEDRPGNITKSQLGRAAAAFSPGGFRGQQVQIPSGDVAKVKAKIRGEYAKLGVEPGDIPAAVKERGLMVYKSGDTYRWATIYSNNYRDRDNPPEIISKAAHEDFAQAVHSGEWPMPELHWWHIKNMSLGVADMIVWDGKSNCAWATGEFVSKEVAVAFASCKDALGVSHGMPRSEIRRDKDDPTIITRYRSAEISILPAHVAANTTTGFYS